MKPPTVLEQGRHLRVVIGEQADGNAPASRGFFADRRVDAVAITRVRARLRLIARAGYPVTNSEAYTRLDGDIHHIKSPGWCAYAMERIAADRVRELIVCVVVERRHSGALDDELKTQTRRIFTEHCARHP